MPRLERCRRLSSQGASTPTRSRRRGARWRRPGGPIIAPTDANSGLQLIPIVRLASVKPAMVPPNTVACGMSFGIPSRNQLIAIATAAIAVSSKARRIAASRPA